MQDINSVTIEGDLFLTIGVHVCGWWFHVHLYHFIHLASHPSISVTFLNLGDRHYDK